MWALRRASNPLKYREFSIGTSKTCYLKDTMGIHEPPQLPYCQSMKTLYKMPHVSSEILMGLRNLSSQARARNSDEERDDFESTVSEGVADYYYDGLVLIDVDEDVTWKRVKRGASSQLFKTVMEAPHRSVCSALEKWVEEGNNVTREKVSVALINLRKYRLYGRALQMVEWLEERKHLNFVERDYASRVDLIARVHGLNRAENYINMIPKSFQTELLYRALLLNCVVARDVAKAESVFNKMRELGFPISAFACNQLILLYPFAMKKIAQVLFLMEQEKVKPSAFTYRLLIDAKGRNNDMKDLDLIVETMKAESIELNHTAKAQLAKHYISGGLNEKAEAVLKDMEGHDLSENRMACRHLLSLYASLGKADQVCRIWKFCSINPEKLESLAAIEAFGKLNKVAEAEAVFEKLKSERNYNALLNVYASHKMLNVGKELVKRMDESGTLIGPVTWDTLVRLFVESGEVEKAESILRKLTRKKHPMRLFVSTYLVIMDEYAKRGDVHNTENIFSLLRRHGYECRMRPYMAIIEAYKNAKAPAYGIRERLKGDDLFISVAVEGRLAQLDVFKTT